MPECASAAVEGQDKALDGLIRTSHAARLVPAVQGSGAVARGTAHSLCPVSEHLPDGAGYLQEGADQGLWHLLEGDAVPDVNAATEVIVAGGVRWSMYDVRAFRAFAESLRSRPATVYVFDLDDAVNESWEAITGRRFPGVTLPDEARYQPPVVVRYLNGQPDLTVHGHTACSVLLDRE